MAKEGLILTGFMGMGKSTVGRALAERLMIGYFDTDEWLETVAQVDVPNLVRSDMAEFRQLEAEALSTILGQEVGVVATGGGIVSTALGRAALRSAKVPVVWLRASFEVAAGRVGNDARRERPLFDDLRTARALFDERQHWYEETSTFTVNASRPTEAVVDAVLATIAG